MTKKKLEPVQPKMVLQLDFMRAKDYLHRAGIMPEGQVRKAVDNIFDMWDLHNGSQFNADWSAWAKDGEEHDRDKPAYIRFCKEMAKIYGDKPMSCIVWW